jgi:hypothetical protein
LLVQAGLIDRLTDSAQSIQPPLAALPLLKEVANRVLDQLVGVLVPAAR